MKVLLASNIHPAAVEYLNKSVDEVVEAPGVSNEELIELISDADAVMIRSKPKLTKEILEHGKNLKVIGRAGVGVDNIDVEYATKKGIIVVNAPEASTTTVAEHTFGMVLALARKIPQGVANVKSGRWDKKKFMGTELQGKTIGIVGMGRIGSRVGEFAKAFKTDIIAYDPYVTEELAEKKGFKLVEMDELLSDSDIITLHMPRTDKTADMINSDAFKKMKSTAFLINCSRGGIVDENALYLALKNGEIAGAALDVFTAEPPGETPLLALDNFISTPHLGASTQEAQVNASLTTAEDILSVLENKSPKNPVNMTSFDPEVLNALNPYIRLCEKLGNFAIQLIDGRLSELSVVFCGSLAGSKGLDILLSTVLRSVLSPILMSTINIVNADLVAKDRGIKVVQGEREDSEDHDALVILKAKTDEDELEIKATVLGGIHPRIIGIDDYEMDITPEGNILIVKHEDKPGIIGNLATTLGHHDINIGSMQVGRKKKGDAQVMAVNIDQIIEEETLTSLSLVDGVKTVKFTKN